MSDTPYNATLVDRHDLSRELSIVHIKPDTGEVPPFIPGQFAMLALPQDRHVAESEPGRKPKMIRRAYSIASSPLEQRFIELLVVLVEEGHLTPRLWDVSPGDRLWLDPRIKGDFTLDSVPGEKDLVLVATGTGIAPFISILRTYIGQRRWRRLILLHGVRRVIDLAYRDELTALAECDPTVAYCPIISGEGCSEPWSGLRGRVQLVLDDDDRLEELAGFRLDPEMTHVFLCGNPDMIKSIDESLQQRGFTTHDRKTAGNIHFERYW